MDVADGRPLFNCVVGTGIKYEWDDHPIAGASRRGILPKCPLPGATVLVIMQYFPGDGNLELVCTE